MLRPHPYRRIRILSAARTCSQRTYSGLPELQGNSLRAGFLGIGSSDYFAMRAAGRYGLLWGVGGKNRGEKVFWQFFGYVFCTSNYSADISETGCVY
jgi:hypothetical protein